MRYEFKIYIDKDYHHSLELLSSGFSGNLPIPELNEFIEKYRAGISNKTVFITGQKLTELKTLLQEIENKLISRYKPYDLLANLGKTKSFGENNIDFMMANLPIFMSNKLKALIEYYDFEIESECAFTLNFIPEGN